MMIVCPGSCSVVGVTLLPLTAELRGGYPADLQKAWKTLDDWVRIGAESSPSIKAMVAYRKLLAAPIPCQKEIDGSALCPLNGLAQYFSEGITLPKKVFDKYSPNLKGAWRLVEDWWNTVSIKGDSIFERDMPYTVKRAYLLVLHTEVPGTGGLVFGRDVRTMMIIKGQIIPNC